MFASLLGAAVPGLSGEQMQALEAHYRLLERWNRSLNLTTIERLEDVVLRHYAESLFVGRFLEPSPQRIVDIGSGAGFPGFPLAILRPDCTVTLVESHQRKAVFLKEASRRVANIRVVAKRAEEVRESFDWAVSRAVSYTALREIMPRMAPSAAFLGGLELGRDTLRYVWQGPIPVPWGERRFLWVGQAR